MARSEFRFNNKRKHYSYLFKDIGTKRKNILITTKAFVRKSKKHEGKITLINVPLYRHPNPRKDKTLDKFYLIPRIYVDDIESFSTKLYRDWKFDINDKRKVKKLKKGNKKSRL